MKQPTDTILTITGSDGTGGSGIQADTLLMAQMGARAVSAVTSITMQNTLGIQEFFDLPADVVARQIEALIDDLQPQVVKVGLLRRIDVVEAVCDVLERRRPSHVVYDPIVRSAHGDLLISPDVVSVIGRRLLPLCTVVLEPTSDRSHGHGNRFASAVCVFLSHGDTVDEALARARDYVQQLPLEVGDASGRSSQLYHQFVEAVEQSFRHNSDVAFYASQLSVSSRYLAQVTRRASGRSPKQIIDERLLHELERELSATLKPLKALAIELGFSSQAHLAKFFKKQRGVSPTEFRRTNG